MSRAVLIVVCWPRCSRYAGVAAAAHAFLESSDRPQTRSCRSRRKR